MTVTVDVVTENVQAADPQTFSHAGGGSPEGVLLLIAHNSISTDIIDGPVTYGGTAMTRVRSDADTAGEPGRSYIYFLGSSVPTGTQTVSIGRTQATQTMVVYCVTLNGNGNLEVIDNDGIAGGDPANPQVTLQFSSREAMSFGVIHSGLNLPANLAELGDQTRLGDHDYGNQIVVASRLTTAQTSDDTFGYTSSAEDVAFSACAVAESSQTVTAGLISQTAATFSPTITPGAVTVAPGLISQLAAVFDPSIAEGAASQGVTAGLISQLAATFSPTITPGAVTVAPSLVGVAASVFAPGIEVGDAPTFGGGLATIIRKSRRR